MAYIQVNNLVKEFTVRKKKDGKEYKFRLRNIGK